MAAVASSQPQSKRWADNVDDNDDEESTEPVAAALPPSTVTGPDKDGIKIYTEYAFNEAGQKIKITRKVKVTNSVVRINKRVQERRAWAKFGACRNAGAGPEAGITSFGDPLFLDLTPKSKKQQEQTTEENQATAKTVTCRLCGGNHWTTKCPYKDTFKDKSAGIGSSSAPPPSGDDDDNTPLTRPLASGGAGKYVPPNLRDGAGRRAASDRTRERSHEEETASLRVTNLPEDCDDQDLRDLFGRFGNIQRVHLVTDHVTGESRGFAFIHFYNKSDAERALERVDGYPYNHMILSVEWAKPRKP